MRVPTREALGIVGIVGMIKKLSTFKGLRALFNCGNARGTRAPAWDARAHAITPKSQYTSPGKF